TGTQSESRISPASTSPDLLGVPGTALRFGGYPAGLVESAAALAEQWGYTAATGNDIATTGAPTYGDHWPYAQLLLPALVVSKGHDPFYHTPYDTADRLDYEDMRWTAALSGALALRLAQR
ncbi:MAG: M28 family peptidase, partial [Anaerolineae bacterium]